MKEKVSISDINIPNNFKDIKTNYNITLYDKDTGEIVYSTDGHNKLNPNLGLRPWCMTYGAHLTSTLHMFPSDYGSYELPTGIYFYNSPDDPSSNHIAGPQRGTFLGGGEVNQSNSAANRCSYNPNESKYEIVFEEGQPYKHSHIVLDATTSQLNGEINTVVIGANRYLSVNGVYNSGLFAKNPCDSTGTTYAHQEPRYGNNASIMSHHPDRPAWLSSQVHDHYVYGSWSFDSDNTAWFSPYRSSGNIDSPDDVVLFHYDLINRKVLGTIKLSLPSECIGKSLVAYKFDDCIGLYPLLSYNHAEDSNGNITFYSDPSYIFNMNGDYVKSIQKSLRCSYPNRVIAIDGKLYLSTFSITLNHNSFYVFDAELNVLDNFRAKDYMDDSRFGSSTTEGKYYGALKFIVILDSRTGERRLTFGGYGANNSKVYGETNLSWNLNTGQLEWLPNNSIYSFHYNHKAIGTSPHLAVVFEGLPFLLPTAGNTATQYWPVMWHHWCKLPSPVTKTANTTMKIQIDLYYPIVSPFAFAAPPDTQASTTES